MNRKQKRIQYSLPSRSKPYCKRSKREQRHAFMGHQRFMRLLDRGFALNGKVVKRRRIVGAVKDALGI